MADYSTAGLLVVVVAGTCMTCMTGADMLGESINRLLSDTNNEDLVETIDKRLRSSANVLSVQQITGPSSLFNSVFGSQAFVDVKIETVEGLSTSAVRSDGRTNEFDEALRKHMPNLL